MNKKGGFLLGLIAVWGALRLLGPNSSPTREKVMGKAEQLRGRFQQAVGSATGSRETQTRGEFGEAKGLGREKVADVESAIDEITR